MTAYFAITGTAEIIPSRQKGKMTFPPIVIKKGVWIDTNKYTAAIQKELRRERGLSPKRTRRLAIQYANEALGEAA
jgi:hypothetical protein